MSTQIKWPAMCALLAVVLQCIGCAADAVGVDSSDARAARSLAEAAGSEGTSSEPGDPITTSVSANRPTWVSKPAEDDPRASPYLATESEFIDRGGISSERADLFLESRELFSNALQRMSEDEGKSMEAQNLARRYRNALERAVGTQGVVDDLTCGVSLCMGSVSSRSRADRDAWAERLYEDADAARHVTFDVFEMNGDRLHNRFMFSADAAIKGIVLPPRRDK